MGTITCGARSTQAELASHSHFLALFGAVGRKSPVAAPFSEAANESREMGDFRQKEVDANFTHSSQESFTFSCFNDDGSIPSSFDDHELFFDMDVTLPLPWDHVGDNIGSLHSPETQEFEFRMSFSESASSMPGAVSPADELFYKGQLLPLHLPPRLRMVERLSARIASEDEEPDISSVLLSCYWKSRDALEGCKRRTSDECEAALPVTALSCSSHSRSGADSRSRVSSSESPWIECTDRSLQDPYIFPNCYRDAALQIIENEAVRGGKFQFSWRKPSLRWRVHMPGARRSMKVGIEDRNLFPMTPKLRDYHQKEQQKWTVLKFRAPASFLKSMFAAGDHQVPGGRKSSPIENQNTSVSDEDNHHRSAANEEPLMQPFRHSPTRKADSEEGGLLDPKLDPQQLGFSSAAVKDKELRLVNRARECFQRYLKLLKPMYVMFSQKSNESDNNLLSIKQMDTAAAAGAPGCAREVMHASAFVSESHRGDTRQELMEPAGHQHHHHKNIHRFTSRTTSLPRRSRGNGPSTNHSGLVRAFSDTHQGNCSRSQCVETENSIKGAIAHCKQSAQAG